MKAVKENYFLIIAHGGFGKTTYMRNCIKEENSAAIWVNLTTMYNTKNYFCLKWIQEMNRICDINDRSLCEFDTGFSNWDFSMYENETLQRDGETCVQESIRLLEQYGKLENVEKCVVIDNVEVLENEEVKELIESMMQHDMRIKWYFVGRMIPDFLVKFCIRGECKVIGENRLYLSNEIILKEVKKELGIQEDKAWKLTNVITEHFHGWAAGTGEMIRCLKSDVRLQNSAKADWEKAIMNSCILKYTKNELFSEIPSEELKFLKMLSVLPQEDEELGKLLLFDSGLGVTQEELVSKYFFLEMHNQGVVIWQGFRIMLKQMLSVEEIRRIKRIVARHYITEGEYQKANVYVLKSLDVIVIQDYLKDSGDELWTKGRMDLLVDCILFLLESRKPLANEVLRMFGKCYCEQDIQEQKEFFMALLSYNEDSMRMSRLIAPFFYKMRKSSNQLKKIQIISFGNFRVKVLENGKELSWRTKKGCELFAYLSKMRGTPVSRQNLMDILWEDEIPKNAVTMLHNMIYNIRKELTPYGLEEIICYKDKMYSMDVDCLENDLDIWMEISKNTNNLPFLLEHERELQSYPGQYMENIDSQWVTEGKGFFDNVYIDGCMNLARYYIKVEDYKKARRYLNNILVLDNLREEALEQLLFCYGKLGERKQVQEEYRRFTKIIRKELNVEPCQKVQLMYDVVMKMNSETQCCPG